MRPVDEFSFTLSVLDEARFGVRSAHAFVTDPDQVPKLLQSCQANQVEFLITRLSIQHLPAVHVLETYGFQLMDTLVYYVRELGAGSSSFPTDTDTIRVRPAMPEDTADVVEIASLAFSNYDGHYHSDPRLDPKRCTAVYASWAERSCTIPGVVDRVLVAETEKQIIGFCTLRQNNPSEGEGILFAVSPAWRGRGVFRSLLAAALDWCQQGKMRRMVYSTQITNRIAQHTLAAFGFEIQQAYYTFHKWFDQ